MAIGDEIGSLKKRWESEKTRVPLVRKRKIQNKKPIETWKMLCKQSLSEAGDLKSTGLDLTNLTPEQIKNLPFPQLLFASQDPIVSGKTIKEMQNKNPEASGYLEDFLVQTGVDPQVCGRVVVNMSGQENLCGYRAILSQIDQDSAGTAFAHSFQGEQSQCRRRQFGKPTCYV
jgi:hypothetical protein